MTVQSLRSILMGMPQSVAAEKLGVSQPYVSMLVRRKERPSPKLLERAQEVWPDIDLEATSLEYMSEQERIAVAARELLELLDMVFMPGGGFIAFNSGYAARVRQAADVLEEVIGGA